jgi:hypothetical protein
LLIPNYSESKKESQYSPWRGLTIIKTDRDSISNNNHLSRKKKDKLIHSSFRLEESVLERLQDKADKEDLTLSKVVSKILKDYVNSEMQFKQLGFIPTSRHFLKKVFEKLDEKYIEDIGRELGLTIAREYVSYFFPKVTPQTLVEYLDLWFARFQSFHHTTFEKSQDEETKRQQQQLEQNLSSNYNIKTVRTQHVHEYEEDISTEYILHNYILNHEININFTMAMKSMLEGLIEPLIKRNVNFKELTNSSISFSFEILKDYPD